MWKREIELNSPYYYRKLNNNGVYLGYRDVCKFEHPYFKKCYSEEYYQKWLSNKILEQNSQVFVLGNDIDNNYKKPKVLKGLDRLVTVKLSNYSVQIFKQGFDYYFNFGCICVATKTEKVSNIYGGIEGIKTHHYKIRSWIEFTNLGVLDNAISFRSFVEKINSVVNYFGASPNSLDMEKVYKGYLETLKQGAIE